jgi:hypothetical protein
VRECGGRWGLMDLGFLAGEAGAGNMPQQSASTLTFGRRPLPHHSVPGKGFFSLVPLTSKRQTSLRWCGWSSPPPPPGAAGRPRREFGGGLGGMWTGQGAADNDPSPPRCPGAIPLKPSQLLTQYWDCIQSLISRIPVRHCASLQMRIVHASLALKRRSSRVSLASCFLDRQRRWSVECGSVVALAAGDAAAPAGGREPGTLSHH